MIYFCVGVEEVCFFEFLIIFVGAVAVELPSQKRSRVDGFRNMREEFDGKFVC